MLFSAALLEFVGDEPEQFIGRLGPGEFHTVLECGVQPVEFG